MKIEVNKVVKSQYNPRHGRQYYNEKGCIFWWHGSAVIKEGDIVKCERDSQGFYRRIWINDILFTADDFADVHGESARLKRRDLT